MEDEKRCQPRLIPAQSEVMVPVDGDDDGSDLDTGNYIAQLANAWAAVRKKPIERQ
jgi:hypothetical protein